MAYIPPQGTYPIVVGSAKQSVLYPESNVQAVHKELSVYETIYFECIVGDGTMWDK